MKTKKIIALLVAVVMTVGLFAACSTDSAATASTQEASQAASSEAASTEAAASEATTVEYGANILAEMPAWYAEPSDERREICKVEPGQIGSTGYASGAFGDKAVSYTEVALTAEQEQKIKDAKLTAAICMGFTGDDWSKGIVTGIRNECERLGIEVIAETQADFKDTKQISDIEAVSAQKPDMLFSIPVNPLTEASAYKKLTEQGIKVVFIDQQCNDMVAGKDFVSVVTADNYGIGLMIADELAKAINYEGDVASLYYNPDYYVTNCRFEGFVNRIAEKYPNINLVDVQGFDDWQNAQDATAALLTKYPNLKGMYGSWDVPAVGVVAAAKLSGRTPKDFAVTIEDLGNEMALNMAQGGFIKGVGAQQTHLQGKTQVDSAALACIGGTPPTFVVVPGLEINIDNLDTQYPIIYDVELPQDVADARNATLGK